MRSIVAVIVLGLLTAPVVWAEPVTCERSILKASTKLVRVRAKALRTCEDRKLRGALPPATECAVEPTAAVKIAKAETKLRSALARACGGPDRTCGTADDEPLGGIGWPGVCPEFQELGCTNAIAGCDDIADCLVCIDEGAVDQAVGLAYDELVPAADAQVLRCQRAMGAETARLLDAKTVALRKCWDARLKGRHANPCPSPGDGKAASKIAKAVSKARTKICKACGGSDRACGGGDDPDPATLGFPLLCPGIGGCGSVIGDLDDLATCLACVAAADVDCGVPLAVPGLAAYPPACTGINSCPTALALTGDSPGLEIDMGFTGWAHDLTGPWIGELTLGLFGCAGVGDPTCGTCVLSGPIRNDGGPAVATERCADGPWIDCAADADCVAAGVTGPCVFFLGPPQPVAALGVTSCVLTEITGPVTGTVDVEAGSLAVSLPVVSRLYIASFAGDDPCPRCVAGACDAGPRLGLPCTVQGTSPLFGSDVTLDCPPALPPQGADAEFRYTTPLGAGPRLVTTSAASPACTASGFAGASCLCDTCNNGEQRPCARDTDCPETAPGVAGICGGKRCLGGVDHGVPCTGPSDCANAVCARVGEPTKPNDCSDSVCTATAADEGECAAGPYQGYCTIESFRTCIADSECPAPGDGCSFLVRECYTDNGVIGMSVSASGSADPPLGGVFNPTLAGLACVPPTTSGAVNFLRGLPGLARVEAPVAAVVLE